MQFSKEVILNIHKIFNRVVDDNGNLKIFNGFDLDGNKDRVLIFSEENCQSVSRAFNKDKLKGSGKIYKNELNKYCEFNGEPSHILDICNKNDILDYNEIPNITFIIGRDIKSENIDAHFSSLLYKFNDLLKEDFDILYNSLHDVLEICGFNPNERDNKTIFYLNIFSKVLNYFKGDIHCGANLYICRDNKVVKMDAVSDLKVVCEKLDLALKLSRILSILLTSTTLKCFNKIASGNKFKEILGENLYEIFKTYRYEILEIVDDIKFQAPTLIVKNNFKPSCVADLLELAKTAAIKAGERILDYYDADALNIEYKNDGSAVTNADLASHKEIIEILSASNIPICSEEKIIELKNDSDIYWLIDPMDGTKEFINHTDEFSVCIALIKDKIPIIGVVYIPVTREIYYAAKNLGCYKDVTLPINQSVSYSENKLRHIRYNTSRDIMLVNLNKNVAIWDKMSVKYNLTKFDIGSAIKFVKLCEESAGVYMRITTNYIWDNAAGCLLVTESGGKMIDVVTRKDMVFDINNISCNNFIAVSRKYADKIEEILDDYHKFI